MSAGNVVRVGIGYQTESEWNQFDCSAELEASSAMNYRLYWDSKRCDILGK
jgi:hypothetical protein